MIQSIAMTSRPRLRFALVLLAPALALCAASVAAADTIKVGKNGITTIQQAIDAALANADTNDTVLIPGGTYDELVSITLTGTIQKRLTVQRSGAAEATIHGTGGNPAVRVQDSAHVFLKDLTLQSGTTGDGFAALEIKGSSLDIHGEKLRGVVGDDFGVMITGANVSGVTLDDCDFSGVVGYGYQLDGKSSTLTRCRADSCALNAVVFTPSSKNCAIKSCTFDAGGFVNPLLPGVVAVQGIGHRIEKTTVSNGGAAGFFVNGALAGGVLFDRCTARNNLIGLRGGGPGVLVSKGTYKKNTSHGMYLDQGGLTVRGATISGNGGQGILVLAAADTTTIVSSKFKSNAGEAVFCQGAFAWLEGNTASGDGFDNDEVTGSQNSGRGNKTDPGQVNDFK